MIYIKEEKVSFRGREVILMKKMFHKEGGN